MSAPHNNHRHCYLLRGDPNRVLPAFLALGNTLSSLLICAQDITPYQTLTQSLHNKNKSDEKQLKAITFNQVRNELGQTHAGVLVDLTHGISASALAILAGTVVGDGVFSIALPDTDWLAIDDDDMARHLPWPLQPSQVESYFKRYFLGKLIHKDSPFTSLALPLELPLVLEKIEPVLPIANANALIRTNTSIELTPEQIQVQAHIQPQVQAALTTAAHKKSNHVLIAPRGRGKSTLLGDTIVTWVKSGKKVVVTAPNADALISLKAHYDDMMNAVDNPSPLPFIAPDALLLKVDSSWDYLVVDEAAMLPVPLLTALLEKANHCVFSTTDFGYEGAGKGFGLRFCRHLAQLDTPLEQLTLQQPIRWGENDPLEIWINQLFFLSPPLADNAAHNSKDIDRSSQASAAFSNKEPKNKSKERQSFTTLQGKDWLTNLPLLETAFNLLVNAHYQTSPDNLRWVMDNPSVTTWLLQDQTIADDHILKSVAIVTSEGQLTNELSQAVLEGTRRPRGHLIPQSLLAHEGHTDAGNYHYWRISRIATEESAQQQGYASQLLTKIETVAQQQQIDFLSTSFAVTIDTVNFWQKNGFLCVRLGTAKDQASGSYSVMMLKPLNENAQAKALIWHQYYLANLTINLPRDYSDIDTSLATKLNDTRLVEGQLSTLANGIVKDNFTNNLIAKDKNDLYLFVHHHRPYLTIRAQLTRLIKYAITNNQLPTSHMHYPLLNTVITQSSAEIDFIAFGLMTKKQVEKHLKLVVEELLQERVLP